jgi:hypothetical protein
MKTFYFDASQLRQLVTEFPRDGRALEAAARLDDFGISLVNNQREFEGLCHNISDHILTACQLGDGFWIIVHHRLDSLPETPPNPVPDFGPRPWSRSQMWKRSRAFWRHVEKHGWLSYFMCTANPENATLLIRNFGVRHPWHLSDPDFAKAWNLVSWGPAAG